MKDKTLFVCGECGYETPKWMGKCPQCGSWNSLVEEEKLAPIASTQRVREKPVPLNRVNADEQKRTLIGIGELDRVLGGGLVGGMVVLLGGDPGIGKSTLLIQVANRLQHKGQVLYASGEESKSQIKLRARRLNIDSELLLLCDTSIDSIIKHAREQNCRYLIVDSIQTMVTESASSAAGSITQVRTCTALLTQLAKETGMVVLIVGHVTKDGTLAGPRVMEHIVDTVLYFEGDRQEGLRLLRAVKNRFGSTNELGVFEMCDDGMREVTDPSRLFVTGENTIGCAITCMMEGSRPLLAEVQSLLVSTAFGSPRRTAIGTDIGRLNLLLAVLEKKAFLRVSDKDVYCNVVGNLKLSDRGTDLAVALCIASALLDKPLPTGTVALGEVGLTGELRVVSQMDSRIRECARQGYSRVIVPRSLKAKAADIELVRAKDLAEAVRLIGNK